MPVGARRPITHLIAVLKMFALGELSSSKAREVLSELSEQPVISMTVQKKSFCSEHPYKRMLGCVLECKAFPKRYGVSEDLWGSRQGATSRA